MSKGPLRFKQSDVDRAIRAARKHPGWVVEIRPDGSIRCMEGAQLPKESEQVAERAPRVF